VEAGSGSLTASFNARDVGEVIPVLDGSLAKGSFEGRKLAEQKVRPFGSLSDDGARKE